MDLSKEIKQYYFDNIASLPPSKQFHFASRIGAWCGDTEAYDLLLQLKKYLAPDPSPSGLKRTVAAIVDGKRLSKTNAHDLRLPYFKKYPSLRNIDAALFRVRHLETVYGIDSRDAFLNCVDKASLDNLATKLENDDEAIRMLSTFAINFLYLYKGLILEQQKDINPQLFINIGQDYDNNKPKHLQLLIYLFTHCIINETNFYVRDIPSTRLPDYIQMLKILEPLIERAFEDINLDNKLEYLVCCRICNYDTPLFKRIFLECRKSLSNKGTFLIDRHNSNIQADRETFSKSEHRNVLFIMSSSGFKPHSTLIR